MKTPQVTPGDWVVYKPTGQVKKAFKFTSKNTIYLDPEFNACKIDNLRKASNKEVTAFLNSIPEPEKDYFYGF